MTGSFEDHLNRANQMLLVMATMPYTVSLSLKEQAEVVYRYELMRGMIEHAKPYCLNSRDRLQYAYVAHAAGIRALKIKVLLDMALLECQGGHVTIETFGEAMGWKKSWIRS